MKRIVTFRRYEKPTIDEETGESERGDFIASFKKEIEGNTLLDISYEATELAKQRSRKWDEDVRVWEIPMF